MPRPKSGIRRDVSAEMRALAQFLRDCVDECGITQKELALTIKVSEQRLSEFMRGEVLPLPDVVKRIVAETVPTARRPMMTRRAERLHGAAEAAPHAPALVRSARQVETLLAQKERLFQDLDALRRDGALLVAFLMRMIARLDRQLRDLTAERDDLRRDRTAYSAELDALGRELWRTKQQRERAGQKLETAQEQRAEAEQRCVAAQLEIEELQAELAKLRAEQGATAGEAADGTRSTSRQDGVTELSDDIDDALSKIDTVLHTQAENIQRLSEPEDDTPSGYPPDNPAAGDDGSRPDRPDRTARGAEPDSAPEDRADGAEAAPPPPTTAAEAAGCGPLHVLRFADTLWRDGQHATLVAQLERAVVLQTPEEIETTRGLLKGLKDGHDIHSLLESVLTRHSRRPRTPAPPPPESSEPTTRPPAPAGFVALTVAPHTCGTVRPCPIEEAPDTPPRHSTAVRALLDRHRADTLLLPGSSPARPPMLDRQDERERLVRVLARGRSVRLTGARGSGRTTLLDWVATDCSGIAPDGVVRLSGHGKDAPELLYELCAAVFDLKGHRIGRARLDKLLPEIGAIVVVDDLGFGGAELDALLDATPECAFLFSATPHTPEPSGDAYVQEVHLSPLGPEAGRELLSLSVGRELTENEGYWATDVWFVTEGLPLSHVQAGALLRYRTHTSLPRVAHAAAPAALLASWLSEDAREVLRLAVALGGEVPHHWHLPVLLGRPHSDTAVAELAQCGLVTAAGARYRLADGVVAQLEAEGYGVGAIDRLRSIGEYYAWYAGHAEVTSHHVALEAPAVLATLAGLGASAGLPCAVTAVQLARAASAKLAAAGAWDAWGRALNHGLHAAHGRREAAADAACLRHELGLLALCRGDGDAARAALSAAVDAHTSVSDAEGAERGRRALRLLSDRRATEPVATRLHLAAPAPA
ncbi:helix-turn-helix domain-containing protein [Streptomyces sp. 5-8]|uniref:Helix-turn-helix domain-containing protein n=1 Tax=Streptomyces musisoli TaxID=2802280 RepID=A0ABS1P080_9ACTN|nr:MULTISPECIES: helix-turn-helix transcriptional regulator [Streptomyces]MBL1105766.1 helix-turn-helix domain-containing protein [Streptomyces musisoli]MBY8841654.1 helix-turn-helix domain-containing protein [Streptomyces sp. SP2-10]